MTSTLTLAETVPITTNPSNNLSPDYFRSYTGFKISIDKEKNEGKMTLQVYHIKRGDKDFFWYTVMYCTESGMTGGCSAYSNGWIEGKIAGQNWIIRDGNFDAVLGKNNGNVKSGSLHAILDRE